MREEFGPELVQTLTEALEIAWNVVRASGQTEHLDERVVRELLAAQIITAANSTRMNKLVLANVGIRKFQELRQSMR